MHGKLTKLLTPFGKLSKEPEVRGSRGVPCMAKVTYVDASMAREAVKTLHGVDIRLKEEKRAAGGRPPAENEKFWVQIAAAPPPSRDACVVVRGFPSSWDTAQLRYIVVAFGGASSINFVPDASYGRAAHVVLKDPAKMAKASAALDGTWVGDGDVIEQCLISCTHDIGDAERARLAEEAKARAVEAEARKLREAEIERKRKEAEEERRRLEEIEAKEKAAAEAILFQERLRQKAQDAKDEELRRKQEERKRKEEKMRRWEEDRMRREEKHTRDLEEKIKKEEARKLAEAKKREEHRVKWEEYRMKREEVRTRREEQRMVAENEAMKKEEEMQRESEVQAKIAKEAQEERRKLREEERQRKEEKMRKWEESRMAREEVRQKREEKKQRWEEERMKREDDLSQKYQEHLSRKAKRRAHLAEQIQAKQEYLEEASELDNLLFLGSHGGEKEFMLEERQRNVVTLEVPRHAQVGVDEEDSEEREIDVDVRGGNLVERTPTQLFDDEYEVAPPAHLFHSEEEAEEKPAPPVSKPKRAPAPGAGAKRKALSALKERRALWDAKNDWQEPDEVVAPEPASEEFGDLPNDSGPSLGSPPARSRSPPVDLAREEKVLTAPVETACPDRQTVLDEIMQAMGGGEDEAEMSRGPKRRRCRSGSREERRDRRGDDNGREPEARRGGDNGREPEGMRERRRGRRGEDRCDDDGSGRVAPPPGDFGEDRRERERSPRRRQDKAGRHPDVDREREHRRGGRRNAGDGNESRGEDDGAGRNEGRRTRRGDDRRGAGAGYSQRPRY